METFFVMLKNVIIFVLLAVPGYLLVKSKVLKPQESNVLSKILTNLGMPALIFANTISLDLSGEFLKSLLVVVTLCVVFHVLAYFVFGKLCHGEKDTCAMMRFCTMFSNSGFIGIPLVSAVFPGNANILAYVTLANIIMNITMFTLGIYMLTGDKSAINIKKAIFSPVLLAFLAGVAVNLLGAVKAVPEIATYVNHLKGVVTPISMIVLGMKLAEVPLKRLFSCGRMYYVSFLRLVAYPVVATTTILLLRRIPGMPVGVDCVVGFFVGVAMPTASLSSAFADRFGGDAEGAVMYTLGTTIFSVLTIPVLYWMLSYML